MEIEFRESKKNRLLRLTLISIAGFIVFFGILYTVLQLLMNNQFLSSIGLPIVLIGYWLKKRICKIKKISQDSVLIESGKKEITLCRYNFSVFKLIKFTISQRFLFAIYPNNRSFFTNTYLVFNDPEYDFFNRLKSVYQVTPHFQGE